MKLVIVVALVIILFVGAFILTEKRSPSTAMQSSAPAASLVALVGKAAPDFTLQSYDGKNYTLSQLRGKKVILFFNEGIMCYPACWNQIASLGSDQQLNNSRVMTASIVSDSRTEWLEAVRKMPALGKETILLDTDTKVSSMYDMLNLPSSMHKGMKAGHTYVIVDENGVVSYAYDDTNMGINNTKLEQEVAK